MVCQRQSLSGSKRLFSSWSFLTRSFGTVSLKCHILNGIMFTLIIDITIHLFRVLLVILHHTVNLYI